MEKSILRKSYFSFSTVWAISPSNLINIQSSLPFDKAKLCLCSISSPASFGFSVVAANLMGVCIRVLCTHSDKIYVTLTLAVESASLALDLSAHLLSDISAESILYTHFSICTNFWPAGLYFGLLSVQLQMIQFIALTLPRPCAPLVALRCSEPPRMLFLYHRLSDPYCCSGCSTI